MSDVTTEVALLKKDIDQLKAEVQELRADIKDLITAWNTAGTVVSFVKWLAGFLGAAGVVLATVFEWKK
jgi:hypothetical protein